jgi:hypothetical protein
MKKIPAQSIVTLLVSLVVITLMMFVVKGSVKNGKLQFQYQDSTAIGGPFEASNSSSRYALVEAMVDQHTFFLNIDQAKFASPDVSDYRGKYLSLFTPGVSMFATPFYVIGKRIGFPQLVTYFFTLLCAVFDIFLIAKLAKKIGAGFYSSLFGGLAFVFATNALSYSLTLTQHIFSVALLITAVLNASEKRTFWRDILFGVVAGVATLVDLPNIIMLLPVGIYVIAKHFEMRVEQEGNEKKEKFSFSLSIIGLAIGILPFAGLFLFYNHFTTGSYTKLAQTIGRTQQFRDGQTPGRTADSASVSSMSNENDQRGESSVPSVFNTRRQLAGLDLLLLSDERGWFYYEPIVFIGIIGLFFAYSKKGQVREVAILTFGVILFTITIYSMFGDPWGGWAFGPRYLISATAFACAGIGVALQKLRRNPVLIIATALLLVYGIVVNTTGAMTTSLVPPKIEADSLANPIPHTYEYNENLLGQNFSSSLIYQTQFSQMMTSQEYAYLFMGCVSLFLLLFILASQFESKEK